MPTSASNTINSDRIGRPERTSLHRRIGEPEPADTREPSTWTICWAAPDKDVAAAVHSATFSKRCLVPWAEWEEWGADPNRVLEDNAVAALRAAPNRKLNCGFHWKICMAERRES